MCLKKRRLQAHANPIRRLRAFILAFAFALALALVHSFVCPACPVLHVVPSPQITASRRAAFPRSLIVSRFAVVFALVSSAHSWASVFLKASRQTGHQKMPPGVLIALLHYADMSHSLYMFCWWVFSIVFQWGEEKVLRELKVEKWRGG